MLQSHCQPNVEVIPRLPQANAGSCELLNVIEVTNPTFLGFAVHLTLFIYVFSRSKP